MYCSEWDSFVDLELNYLISKGFDVKFWNKTNNIFSVLMQFLDLVSVDHRHMQYDDDIVLASIFYLLVGGKDIMGVFNYDYEQLPERLLANGALFPIQDE